jgi:hypothetical protein
MKKGSAEERNKSHPLDLSTKDQQLLDLEVSAGDLTLVCAGEWACQTPEVLKLFGTVHHQGGQVA